MRRLLPAVLLLVLVLGAPARAQELDCRVTVNFSTLSGNEFSFLTDLQRQLEEYLNQRSWTEDRFEDYERINCTFGVTITEAVGLDRFRATVAVGSSRPIYGSPQRTTSFQVVDAEWSFQYARGEPLIYSPSRFDDLTSFVDFYAYLVLGYDYDTFSELGGTPYFQKAREIAELAQSQAALGWESLAQDRTRTTLVQQLTDARFEPLRRAQFLYHLGALDRFSRQPELAWENATTAITALYDLYTEVSRRYATDVFFGTKSRELPALFAEAPQRSEIYALLIEMDPAHQSDYDVLSR